MVHSVKMDNWRWTDRPTRNDPEKLLLERRSYTLSCTQLQSSTRERKKRKESVRWERRRSWRLRRRTSRRETKENASSDEQTTRHRKLWLPSKRARYRAREAARDLFTGGAGARTRDAYREATTEASFVDTTRSERNEAPLKLRSRDNRQKRERSGTSKPATGGKNCLHTGRAIDGATNLPFFSSRDARSFFISHAGAELFKFLS